jgi:hypothetical protein
MSYIWLTLLQPIQRHHRQRDENRIQEKRYCQRADVLYCVVGQSLVYTVGSFQLLDDTIHGRGQRLYTLGLYI